MPLVQREAESAYFDLYRKAKQLHWDPAAIDLRADRAQWQDIRRDYAAEQFPEQILRLTSLFYEGEESVTKTLAPFCSAVSRLGLGIDKELFLTTQLYEEAKHFEFFARYFAEVFEEDGAITQQFMTPAPQAVLVSDLEEVTERLRREDDPARCAQPSPKRSRTTWASSRPCLRVLGTSARTMRSPRAVGCRACRRATGSSSATKDAT